MTLTVSFFLILSLRKLCFSAPTPALRPAILDNLRSERHDLHESLVAQLTRHRSEYAGTHRLSDLVDQYRSIRIETDVGAVFPASLFPHPHHNTADNLALLNVRVRRGFLYRRG